MKVAVCLVGMDMAARAIALSAARLAFPQAAMTSVNSIEAAMKLESASVPELLILANPEKISVATALAAMNACGLRRWAIVILDGPSALEGVETVPAKDWTEPVLMRVFRAAVVQHQLRCENERLYGDLRTLALRISHDLRTPLGGILSAGEGLQEVVAELSPANAALTKPLFSSVDDLKKLIDRVSLVTKASANPVSKKSVAMADVVWAVLQRHERQILKHNAVVTQPDAWPEVEAVSVWLEVVWGNLLTNALQHGKPAARIQLGWTQTEHEFHFWVSDDGAGIPPEKRAGLFQPFHLLHQSNARTGLGLSIVQRLLELQGGQCGYEPDTPGGTKFFFNLPIEKKAEPPHSPPTIPEENPAPAMRV